MLFVQRSSNWILTQKQLGGSGGEQVCVFTDDVSLMQIPCQLYPPREPVSTLRFADEHCKAA